MVLPSEIVGMVILAATAYTFYVNKSMPSEEGSEKSKNFMAGMFWASIALLGNTGVSALRKMLSAKGVLTSAEQVGFAKLIQGVGQFAFLIQSGLFSFSGPFPGADFFFAAVVSSLLGSAVKIMETKAFAESDMSLCAPFLAFDPVMQFVVKAAVLSHTCNLFSFGCDEIKTSFPVHHVLAVLSIAVGAFLLAQAAKRTSDAAAAESKKDDDKGKGKKDAIKYIGPLPLASWMILGNCVIYGFSSRFDKMAITAGKAAVGAANGKTLYNAYNCMIQAVTCLGGSVASGKPLSVGKAMSSDVLTLILGICACEIVYMISLYQAMDTISPVYVTAMKRGGGVLVSSLTGVLLFNETLKGRVAPILMIVSAVVMMIM